MPENEIKLELPAKALLRSAKDRMCFKYPKPYGELVYFLPRHCVTEQDKKSVHVSIPEDFEIEIYRDKCGIKPAVLIETITATDLKQRLAHATRADYDLSQRRQVIS